MYIAINREGTTLNVLDTKDNKVDNIDEQDIRFALNNGFDIQGLDKTTLFVVDTDKFFIYLTKKEKESVKDKYSNLVPVYKNYYMTKNDKDAIYNYVASKLYTMNLSKFLENFDFTYYIDNNGNIKLKDNTDTNLGDIESDEFEDVIGVLDRLDIYYADLYSDMCEQLHYNGSEDYESVLNFLRYCNDSHRDTYRQIFECIVNPDLVRAEKKNNRIEELIKGMNDYIGENNMEGDSLEETFNNLLGYLLDMEEQAETREFWRDTIGFTDKELDTMGFEFDEFEADDYDDTISDDDELDDDFDNDEIEDDFDNDEFDDSLDDDNESNDDNNTESEEDDFEYDDIEEDDLIDTYSYRIVDEEEDITGEYILEKLKKNTSGESDIRIDSNLLYDKYLDDQQIKLLQKYYMLLSQYVFKLDMGNVKLTPAKKAEFDALGRDDKHQWVYAGVVDMGYAGNRYCPSCGAKLINSCVSSCCHKPIVSKVTKTSQLNNMKANIGRWVYNPLKDKNGNEFTYIPVTNGKCVHCGSHCSVVETDKGKKKIVRNQNGLICSKCGNVVTQSINYCTMNHPTRYVHIAWDISSAPLEENFNGRLLDTDIKVLIESDHAIKFGLDCVADFFEIDKKSDAYKALKKVQEICVKDMQNMLGYYALDDKNGNNVEVETVNKSLALLDELAPKIQVASTKLILLKNDALLPTKLMTLYMQMRESGMLIPKSFVKFIRDFLVGWTWTQDKFRATADGFSGESIFNLQGAVGNYPKKGVYCLEKTGSVIDSIFGSNVYFKSSDMFKDYYFAKGVVAYYPFSIKRGLLNVEEVKDYVETHFKESKPYTYSYYNDLYSYKQEGNIELSTYEDVIIRTLFTLYFTSFFLYKICGEYQYNPYIGLNIDEGGKNKDSKYAFKTKETILKSVAKAVGINELKFTVEEAKTIRDFVRDYEKIHQVIVQFMKDKPDIHVSSATLKELAYNNTLGYFTSNNSASTRIKDITIQNISNYDVTREELDAKYDELMEQKMLAEQKKAEEERQRLIEEERLRKINEEKERQRKQAMENESNTISQTPQTITISEKFKLLSDNFNSLPNDKRLEFPKKLVHDIRKKGLEPKGKQIPYIEALYEVYKNGKDIDEAMSALRKDRTALTPEEEQSVNKMMNTPNFFENDKEKGIITNIRNAKGYTEKQERYLRKCIERLGNN